MCYSLVFLCCVKSTFSASMTNLEDLCVKSHLFKNTVNYYFLKLFCDNFV